MSGETCYLAKKISKFIVTPSFLSLSRAPCRKSLDTSSFSSNHMITNGSNQLQKEKEDGSGSPSQRKEDEAFAGSLRRIFRDMFLESGQLFAVLVVEPLHLEMQVHVIGAFTQPVLLML